MKPRVILGLIAVFILALLSGGCGGSAGPDEEGPIVATPVDPELGDIPEDIPVMPGAYDLDVIRGASQINYTVDGSIDDVLAFYQAELESLGWEFTRAPDSAVGAIGSMTREKNGDTLSINMSYNQIGDFVVLQIQISRLD